MAGSGSIGSASGSNASGASGEYIVTTFSMYKIRQLRERSKSLGGSLYFLEFSFAFSSTSLATSLFVWIMGFDFYSKACTWELALWLSVDRSGRGNEHISCRMGRKIWIFEPVWRYTLSPLGVIRI